MAENSKSNALKHGAFSEINFLPGEDPQDFVKLKAGLFAEFKPCGVPKKNSWSRSPRRSGNSRRAQRSKLSIRVLANDTPEPAAAGTN